jgi:uncharacterized protein (TIGR02246 family)
MEEAATTLFSEDADFVNVWGSHWHGRSQIASEHAERHRKQLKGSTFTSRDVSVHYLRTDVALVHISWVIRGDRNLDNSPRQPRQGLFTWVMLKDEAGHWWVRAAHNVHVASAP